MTVHWRTSFTALNGIIYRVDIYDEDYVGNPVILGCGPTPIETAESTDNDIFAPVRTQTGNLNIEAESIADAAAIVPASVLARPMEIVNTSTGAKEWIGYLQDNVFTSNWDRGPLVIGLPVSSPLDVMRSVPFSSDIKYTSLGDILFSIFGTFSLYTDVYIPGEYMGLMFNTVVILGDGLDAATIYPGLGDNSSPPSEKSSCYDMIEEICNYFGWTAHDYGSSLWFIGVDNTQYNRYEIDYDHKELVADATAYTVADIGITLAGAKNKYKYVAGSSYIDWQQRVKTSFTLVRTNLADCTTFGGLSGNAQQYIYISCLSGSAYYYQYNPQTGSRLSDFKDLLKLQPSEVSNFCGGQLVFFRNSGFDDAGKEDLEREDLDPALAIKNGYSGQVAQFRSIRELNGRSFSGGLAIYGETLIYNSTDGFIPDDNVTLRLSLQWGNKYYTGTYWQNSPATFTCAIGSKIHGGIYSPENFYFVDIDPYHSENLVGEIILSVYGFGNASDYNDIRIVKNLDVRGVMLFGRYITVYNPNMDYSENHLRQELLSAKGGIYERNSMFSTHRDWNQFGESFVLNSDGTYYDGAHEADLLYSLSVWKGQTAEQISVDARFGGSAAVARPCDSLTIDGYEYRILHIRTNWRDAIKRYTVQKAPEQE